MKTPDYSVIVPVFNSEESLEELLEQIKKSFQSFEKTFEVIFVDDCSPDNSWEVLQKLKEDNPGDNIVLIRLTQNFGQHKATYCGMNYAKAEFMITIDDDLQNPPEEIIKLIDKQKEQDSDLVYGVFPEKKHSRIRNTGSRMMKRSTKMIDKGRGKGSSFRLIRKSVAEKSFVQHRHFLYIDELLLWYTGNVDYVEVKHEMRKYSRSNYSIGKLVAIASGVYMFSTTLPLKLMVYSGLFFSVTSFGLGVYFIIRKIFYKVPLGFTALIVAILFSTSILLLCIGMMSVYLSQIFMAQNKKPPYLIQKIVR